MDRFYSLASYLCGYLAFALIVLAPLAVPQNAFADSGSDCYSACSAGCGGNTTCMMNCSIFCSEGGCQCGGNPTCEANCSTCVSQCAGNPTCLANCASATAAGGCSGDFCDTPTDRCSVDYTPGSTAGGTGCPGTHTPCDNGNAANNCDTCKCKKYTNAKLDDVCGCRN